MKTRSRAQRGVSLGIAVVLITGGIAGVSAAHGLTISKFASALAILAGLVFLKNSRSKISD